MKIAVLSDIHGNLAALQAVLRHARGQEAAQLILNLGDSVGYGPEPESVVQMMQGKNVINLLGDYDKKVLSKKQRQSGWEKVNNPDKRLMFQWTYQALSKGSRRLLKTYPEQDQIEIEGFKILLTHTSPGSTDEYLGPDTPQEILEQISTLFNVDVILCGHSHRAFIQKVNDVLFINPGSVGRPDDGDPRASYTVLEILDGVLKTDHYRVPYDLISTAHSIRQAGLPEVFTLVLQQGLNYDDLAAHFKDSVPEPNLEPTGILSLLTDFGLTDHFVGVMKGVILDIAPQTKIIDIGHQVRPQNVMQASLMLAESVPYFPPGSVHVAVVDPGVGTQRRALAARIGSHYFVAPDNGLLSAVLNRAYANDEPIEIVALDQPQYWLPDLSRSFHGRDIFAPVGAHLINGILLEKLGTLIQNPVRLILPDPEPTPSGWLAEVVLVDVFGNLSTNLPAKDITEISAQISVVIQDEIIKGITPAFGDAQPGSLIATIDSRGMLAISVVNGSAQEQLNADIGTKVEIFRR